MFPDRTYYRFCFLAKAGTYHADAPLDTQYYRCSMDDSRRADRDSPCTQSTGHQSSSRRTVRAKFPLSLIYEHQNSPLISNLDA